MTTRDHQILNALPYPLVLLGADQRIVAMNPPAVERLGAGLIGRSYVSLRQPALLDCIEQVFRTGQAGRTRYPGTGLDRDRTWSVLAAPLPEGILVSFEDVSELEQAGQARRDFVANVSHELKTPLTAMLGFIETLRGAARDDATARERFLGIMQREAERMNRLVNDLLSLSRVESDERMRPTAEIRLGDLVQSVIASLRPVAEPLGVTIDIDCSVDSQTIVRGDADQLTQVFFNLIDNAVKYGRDGKRVQVHMERVSRDSSLRGPAYHVTVQDFGPGFNPIHIPRLTERFYRVDSHRSREMGGTGLGLAIVKHIVNRHRGRFRIESTPGNGACFTVSLPAVA